MEMKIRLPIFLSLFFALLLVVSPVYAAEFKLTSIGALDVSERLYSHMWYTGSQPTFSGTGTSGATVDITLDGSAYSTTVDANEQWSWTPPEALANADHSLTFTSGGETISLTLTTGSGVPADVSAPAATDTGTPSALPESGFLTPTLAVLGFGALLTLAPFLRKFALD